MTGLMTDAVTYLGVREGLREELTARPRAADAGSIRVIDLVGSGAPGEREITDFISLTEPPARSSTAPRGDAPPLGTIVISSRRRQVDDDLGDLESFVLTRAPSAVVFRSAPADLSIPLLWGWAEATGKLITAFQEGGVTWVNTAELAEAICRLRAEDIGTRAGRGFDLTGPVRVPMSELVDLMQARLDRDIELVSLTPRRYVDLMVSGNGLPPDMAQWIADYQYESSAEELAEPTPVLEALLGRPPAPARLVPQPGGTPTRP